MLQPHTRRLQVCPLANISICAPTQTLAAGAGQLHVAVRRLRPFLEHKPVTPCVQPAAPHTHHPAPYMEPAALCTPQVYNSLAQPLDAVVELPISAASLKLVAGPAAAGPTSVQAGCSPACYGAATLLVRSYSPAC